jgi:hypothetical protein
MTKFSIVSSEQNGDRPGYYYVWHQRRRQFCKGVFLTKAAAQRWLEILNHFPIDFKF